MKNQYKVIMPNTLIMFHNMLYKTCWIDTREAILNLFEDNPGAMLLDYGCNVGEVTEKIMKRLGVSDAWGIDIRDTSNELKDKNIHFKFADINEDISFPDKSFDVIHASNIIEHLSNTDKFVSEMYRLLKMRGYAVVSTCNLSSWHNLLFLLAGRQIPAADVSDIYNVGILDHPTKKDDIGPAHRRLFTLRALRDLLFCHGFFVEECVGVGFYPFTGKLAKFFSTIDKIHSAYIAVKARKI